MILFSFYPDLFFFPRSGQNSTQTCLQHLRFPYLSGCHIIVPPFSTAVELFVVAVFCPAYVLHLEGSWAFGEVVAEDIRCVTWGFFHNPWGRPWKPYCGHYTHTHTHACKDTQQYLWLQIHQCYLIQTICVFCCVMTRELLPRSSVDLTCWLWL